MSRDPLGLQSHLKPLTDGTEISPFSVVPWEVRREGGKEDYDQLEMRRDALRAQDLTQSITCHGLPPSQSR